MRAALLALAACQLSPVQPLRYIQSTDTDSEDLSNIELLIPLLVGEPAPRRARAHVTSEHSERYSSIPAYAFSLDEQMNAAPTAAPGGSHPAGSRKRDLSRQQAAPRMRSAYLEEPDDGRDVWRACARLARARSGPARQALLYLCAELLEPEPEPEPPCPCCAALSGPHAGHPQARDAADPPWFGPAGGRRDLMPMGDNAALVERYMHVPRKKRRSPWLME